MPNPHTITILCLLGLILVIGMVLSIIPDLVTRSKKTPEEMENKRNKLSQAALERCAQITSSILRNNQVYSSWGERRILDACFDIWSQVIVSTADTLVKRRVIRAGAYILSGTSGKHLSMLEAEVMLESIVSQGIRFPKIFPEFASYNNLTESLFHSYSKLKHLYVSAYDKTRIRQAALQAISPDDLYLHLGFCCIACGKKTYTGESEGLLCPVCMKSMKKMRRKP